MAPAHIGHIKGFVLLTQVTFQIICILDELEKQSYHKSTYL